MFLYSIAAMIQAQIYAGIQSIQVPRPEKYPEFLLSPELPEDSGGIMDTIPADVLGSEAVHEPDLRKHLLSGTVPTVHTIFRY
jgi:hypothetical protein